MPATLPVSYTTVSLMMLTFPDVGSMYTSQASENIALRAGNAQALVNAKLARLYSVPFTSEIPLLQTLTTDIAIYNCMSELPILTEEDDDAPFYLRFKSAVDMLDEIANGNLPLVDSEGALVVGRSDVAEVFSNTMDYHPTMHEGSAYDQVIDKDKLDDIADERDLDSAKDRLI